MPNALSCGVNQSVFYFTEIQRVNSSEEPDLLEPEVGTTKSDLFYSWSVNSLLQTRKQIYTTKNKIQELKMYKL